MNALRSSDWYIILVSFQLLQIASFQPIDCIVAILTLQLQMQYSEMSPFLTYVISQNTLCSYTWVFKTLTVFVSFACNQCRAHSKQAHPSCGLQLSRVQLIQKTSHLTPRFLWPSVMPQPSVKSIERTDIERRIKESESPQKKYHTVMIDYICLPSSGFTKGLKRHLFFQLTPYTSVIHTHTAFPG